jgi:hypothetical protein
MRLLSIIFALLPLHCSAEIFYGLANTTLQVNQLQKIQSGGYVVTRTFDVPVAVEYRIESDFDSVVLLGIGLDMQGSIYEDIAHNFEFSFSMEGAITGSGPTDIDAIPTTNDWITEDYWDSLDVHVKLERRIFNTRKNFEAHFLDDMFRFENDQLNFSGYPSSITYRRSVGIWPLGNIDYSETEGLGFYLIDPQVVTLAPAICTHSACGDYNHDQVVNAADYVLWRSTLSQTGFGLDADGNNNNKVDAADYYVWRSNFSKSADFVSGQLTPEPASWLLACLALSLGQHRRR